MNESGGKRKDVMEKERGHEKPEEEKNSPSFIHLSFPLYIKNSK